MLTAHTTIVFIRYIALAWQQRTSNDPRTFGELFFLVSDELQDISFAIALETLLTALIASLKDNLFLSDDQVDSLLDDFFAKLPPCYLNFLHHNCES